MILEHELGIKIASKTKEHYKKLGYDVKVGQVVYIKNEETIDGTTIMETRECDLCHKPYDKRHREHIKTFKRFGMDVCPECVENNEDIKKITKERRKETNKKNLGVENPSQNQEVKKKKEDTLLANFGCTNPMKSDELKEKAYLTNEIKYGFKHASQSEDIKNKIKKTCLEKYGVEYTAQIPESRQKAAQSYYKHGTQKTSSQQFKIYTMLKDEGYDVVLNSPLSSLSLDIEVFYKDNKIDIEYDGNHWHTNPQKDRRRDEVVKSFGYRVLRIKSDKDIPALEQIIEKIDYLIDSDKKFTTIIS